MSDHHGSDHFIVPASTYVKTFITLLFLTVITVLAAQFDFGVLNLPIAMLIALAKAFTVAYIFMGLKWDKDVNSLALIGSAFFLFLFIILTFSDIAYRSEKDKMEKMLINMESPYSQNSTDSHHDTKAAHNSKEH